MPRKTKQDVKINNTASLEGVMQEVYNDACLIIQESQKTINELATTTNGIEITEVEDYVKIAKEKGGLLKVKDSAVRLKLEVAKLQNDILKNSGNIEETISERSNGAATVDDFNTVRNMLKKNKE